jgi:hypothetical protein
MAGRPSCSQASWSALVISPTTSSLRTDSAERKTMRKSTRLALDLVGPAAADRLRLIDNDLVVAAEGREDFEGDRLVGVALAFVADEDVAAERGTGGRPGA